MSLRFTLSLWGDRQLDRTLERYADAVEDARPLWHALADDFVSIEQRQFATEGGYGSGGWSPLSPKYAAWKARHYPGQPILQREGDLVESLTSRPLGVEVIDARRMVIGSDIAHGEFHQLGDGVPQRRPVELTAGDRRRWTRALQRYVVTGEVDV